MPVITLCGPRLLAATAVLATLSVAASAHGQYAPYAAQPQYGAASAQYGQYGAPQATQQQPQTQRPPQYAAQGAYQGYQTPTPTAAPNNYAPNNYTANGYATPNYTAPNNYAAARPGFVPQTQIGAQQQVAQNYGPYTAPHLAMAYQDNAAAPATAPAESLPMTPPVDAAAGAPAMQGGAYIPQPEASADNNYGYGGYAPAGGGYESYPGAQGAAGCATGNCNTGAGYGAGAYGACDTYSTYGGMNGVLGKGCGGGYWFGGVYGLLMDRDNSNKYPLAFTTNPAMPDGYPPADMNVVMTSRDVDVGYQPGVEFRLGRAFGGGGCGNSCDPCGGGGCGGCGAQWGLEGVYWTLFEDDAMVTYISPAAPSRTYTMMPMYGLEYNAGTGYNPVNVYWDHGTPSVQANPYSVTAVRQRSSFEAQNVELNMLRLNICGGGFGPGAYSAACGASACGGSCDSGYGGCATGGCAGGGCAPCAPCGPRYSCTAVCGFRWMQFNEDFMFGVDYVGASSGSLNYNANVENNLFGAQIGCNGMYRVGCKWGLHLNTLVGLYGNDINVQQYFASPTGQIRYINDTANFFDVNANKTDVSMIGELRLGASYQATCRTRLYGGWRVIGISGIALATDQTPNAFLSDAQMASYVNSNGSMILHGLQAGAEWNY